MLKIGWVLYSEDRSCVWDHISSRPARDCALKFEARVRVLMKGGTQWGLSFVKGMTLCGERLMAEVRLLNAPFI